MSIFPVAFQSGQNTAANERTCNNCDYDSTDENREYVSNPINTHMKESSCQVYVKFATDRKVSWQSLKNKEKQQERLIRGEWTTDHRHCIKHVPIVNIIILSISI